MATAPTPTPCSRCTIASRTSHPNGPGELFGIERLVAEGLREDFARDLVARYSSEHCLRYTDALEPQRGIRSRTGLLRLLVVCVLPTATLTPRAGRKHGVSTRPRIPYAPDEATDGGGGRREQGSQEPEQVEVQEESDGAREHRDPRGEEHGLSSTREIPPRSEEGVEKEARGSYERRGEQGQVLEKDQKEQVGRQPDDRPDSGAGLHTQAAFDPVGVGAEYGAERHTRHDKDKPEKGQTNLYLGEHLTVPDVPERERQKDRGRQKDQHRHVYPRHAPEGPPIFRPERTLLLFFFLRRAGA